MKRVVQSRWMGSQIARRYVAGPTIECAVDAAQRLKRRSLLTSAFYLGEYIGNAELVEEIVSKKLGVVEALGASGLDVHVSVDPTQIGYQQSPTAAHANAVRIASEIARVSINRPGVHCLMLDMEDDSIVDATLHFHNELRAIRLPAAVTIQAYLQRTGEDLTLLLRKGAHVRLVKGAYALRGGPAFAKHSEIKENYRKLLQRMLSRDARNSGLYPSIATHDSSMHDLALELADQNGWRADEFEFEMLLGVRSDIATRLAAGGARVRLYVPFGTDWWPHAARRLGESPGNAWDLLRSAFERQRQTE